MAITKPTVKTRWNKPPVSEHAYEDYTDIPSITVPGESYTIQELMERAQLISMS